MQAVKLPRKDSRMLTRLLKKQYWLPAEHGAWIWFFGPFVLGVAVGGQINRQLVWLLLAGLFAFLLRQPITMLVKVAAGRRRRREIAPALVWAMIYSLLGLTALAPLLLGGYRQLILLALPGLLVFGWHSWLVYQRQERRRPGVEVVATGALSLMAPAAYWVAGGTSVLVSAILWATTWLQAAASIVFIHLRLEQRDWTSASDIATRLRRGRRPLSYHVFNLIYSLALTGVLMLPAWVAAAFALMLLDCLEGVLRPAIGVRPPRIGIRQGLMSAAFIAISAIGFAGWAPPT